MNCRALLIILLSFPTQAQTCTQTIYELFGPESRYAYALEYNQMQWSWPGSALTASTQYIRFDSLPPIRKAMAIVVWWPLESAQLKLVAFDGGPMNIEELTRIHTPNRPAANPVPVIVDITEQMQALQAKGVGKYIGYQLHGRLRVGVVRVEVCSG